MKKENIKYLVISTIALYIAPSLIIAAGFILAAILHKLASVLIPFGIAAFLFSFCIAAFSFLFGRKLASSNKIQTPQSLAMTYIPAFIPAAVVPILCFVTMFSNWDELEMFFIYMPNLWSYYYLADMAAKYPWSYSIVFIYLPQIGFDILYGLLYILGIRFGERVQNVKHDKLKIGHIIIFAAYFIVSIIAILLYSRYGIIYFAC